MHIFITVLLESASLYGVCTDYMKLQITVATGLVQTFTYSQTICELPILNSKYVCSNFLRTKCKLNTQLHFYNKGYVKTACTLHVTEQSHLDDCTKDAVEEFVTKIPVVIKLIEIQCDTKHQ